MSTTLTLEVGEMYIGTIDSAEPYHLIMLAEDSHGLTYQQALERASDLGAALPTLAEFDLIKQIACDRIPFKTNWWTAHQANPEHATIVLYDNRKTAHVSVSTKYRASTLLIKREQIK